MRTKELSDFIVLDCFGHGIFREYKIDYTTFKQKSNPQEDEKILDQFIEKVFSRHDSGVRKYIEERTVEEFPNHQFEWDKNSYLSRPYKGKEIYISFEKIGKLEFDAFIFNKEPQ
ncbi:MAG: hypothetical protein KKB62_01365 [Nanoarchaeota archaeon]|nr:hypothetical protein [Nanoarchaeota archaeon]